MIFIQIISIYRFYKIKTVFNKYVKQINSLDSIMVYIKNDLIMNI